MNNEFYELVHLHELPIFSEIINWKSNQIKTYRIHNHNWCDLQNSNVLLDQNL